MKIIIKSLLLMPVVFAIIGCEMMNDRWDQPEGCESVSNPCTEEGFEECWGDPHDYRRCERDPDGCLQWQVDIYCVGPGHVCEQRGYGRVGCTWEIGDCWVGEAPRCRDGYYEECLFNHDHKEEWMSVDCEEQGEICVEHTAINGEDSFIGCAPESPTCTEIDDPCDEFHATRCHDDVVERCTVNVEGCTFWRASIDCGETNRPCMENIDGEHVCAGRE